MFRKKGPCPECVQKIPTWMATFADMVTLLMVFFVMLMALGEVKIVKTLIVLSAFEGKLGLLKGGQSFDLGQFENMGQNIQALPSAKRGKSLFKSLKRAQLIFEPEVKSKKVRVSEDERGIVISLMTDLLFEPGSAKVRIDQIQGVLENIRLLIDSDEFNNHFRIEGHTDERPYQGSEFKDNWDLSVQRSWAVLNALRLIPSLTEFDESKVSIHGYGDTRTVELGDTPEGRQYNRRVDVILLTEDL